MARTKKSSKFIINSNNNFSKNAESFLAPILLLCSRVWMANIFFDSGRNKLSNMEGTIFLFEYQYIIPIIPASISAYLITLCEIAFSVLLFCGLLTRLSAFILIIITIIIQSLIYNNIEHFYWIFMLSTLMIYGSGKISIDHMFKIK
ncbi:DoxX family protein [Rickettsiales bacterium]|nr:DoxX family protein [Rickettsiales bacterium]